nr:transposase [Sinirhodobacter populi]
MRRKIHIGIDAETLEVRAVEMTSNRIGDAPVLPDLLGQIPAEERIGSITADGFYDTKGCHAAIAARGADAIIPPRRNARTGRGTILVCRCETKPCAPANALAGQTGRNGLDITDEVAWRYEGGQKTVRGTVFPTIG